jgi:nucleotide-binding universal stress UspA family protein
MLYKTILVHVDESRHVGARIAIATKLALKENAHLIGIATTGASSLIYRTAAIPPENPAIAPYLDILQQRANGALDKFEATVQKVGVASYEKWLTDDDAAGGISLRGHYCDLVIIGQYDPDEPSPFINSDFPEYVVMNCGCPVLIVPHSDIGNNVGERVLIAWNASVEATRALHSSIPILQRAKIVEVVIFNPDSKPEDVYGVPPGADIKIYLNHHNIDADVITRTTDDDIGSALLMLAKSLPSNFLIMGCYGHSRFREILLGGATRTVLTSMTMPVLMSH